MLIYGIDPGYTGAITLYWPTTGDIEVHDMPTMPNAKGKTVLNMHSILEILRPEDDKARVAFMEQVGAMRGQGVTSMFRFGEQFGALQMVRAIFLQEWIQHF